MWLEHILIMNEKVEKNIMASDENLFHIICSFKQIKSSIKDDESLLLVKKSKSLDVSRVIYDLIVGGIRGDIKKDALLSALTELTVSKIFKLFK